MLYISRLSLRVYKEPVSVVATSDRNEWQGVIMYPFVAFEFCNPLQIICSKDKKWMNTPIFKKNEQVTWTDVNRQFKNKVSTTNWHLPSTFARIKSYTASAADFQHPLKGVLGGEQKWGTLCSGWWWWATSGNYLLSKTIFLGVEFYEHKFLYLLISRKALKSLWRHLLLMTRINLLQKICAWLHALPLHQNHIYTDIPPLILWISFSEISEMLSPRL